MQTVKKMFDIVESFSAFTNGQTLH